MQFKDGENHSETGGLYIVRDPTGAGKTIVRRPHPPPTTLPLDDDFDAYTVDTEWVPPHTNAELQPVRSSSHSNLRDHSRQQKRPDRFASLGDRRRNKQVETDHDAYERYMEDMERAFGSDVGVGLVRRENGLSGTDGGISELPLRSGRAANDTNGRDHSRNGLRPRVGSNASLARVRRDTTGEGTVRPERAPSGYDRAHNPRGLALVQQKVLEDGPERTVTVWREEVARTASESGDRSEHGQDVEVSVYYQGFNGGLGIDVDGGEAGKGYDEFGRMAGGNDGSASKGTGKTRPMIGEGRGSLEWAERQKSPLRRSFPNPSYVPHLDNVGSTIADTQTPGTPRPKANKPIPVSPPRTSTPTRVYSRPPPISSPSQPANSSSSGKATNLTRTSSFEALLSSSQPSLLHIASVLVSIGIRSKDHLRAVARMRSAGDGDGNGVGSEGYKEVREEALSKGVTVVEWAILMGTVSE